MGPIYTWMNGGNDSAMTSGAAEVASILESLSNRGLAVDLGAECGTHAIPLARQGFRVVAIDTCAALLDELQSQQGDLPIETVVANLQSFRQFLPQSPVLVLCVGDTITHLPDQQSVKRLIETVSAQMDTGGYFVITLRDYATALNGEQGFIKVRSDADRILTCFLEYSDTHVTVHDIVHQRDGSHWKMTVSSYCKLRLSPVWLVKSLEEHNFAVEQHSGKSGIVHLLAQRI